MPSEQQRLEAIKRELDVQNEAWERMKLALSRLGDACLDVPCEPLEALDELSKPAASALNAGVRG